MSDSSRPTEAPAPRVPRWRVALWLGLLASWLVILPLMTSAVVHPPSPERLRSMPTLRIPTPATLLVRIATSGLELRVVLVLLWPWRVRAWRLRLAGTALAVTLWFLLTPPLGLSIMEWYHRRWLAAVAAVLLVAAALSGIGAVVRRGA